MASTPPPAKRIRTPPTPLHGPRYDSYEPYSPRRSNRIASRASYNASFSASSNSSSTPKRSWNSDTPSTGPVASTRNSTHAFSSPSSPVSPAQRIVRRTQKAVDALSPRKQRQVRLEVSQDSDSDAAQPVPMEGKSTLGAGMLPTPAKTPRKRAVPNNAVNTTARVLFPGRMANAEDAMPPRKSRNRRTGLLSLDGLDEDGDDEAGRISIYTDSKERVPDPDEGAENPFVVKSKGKNRATETNEANGGAMMVQRKKRGRQPKALVEEEAEMERKAQNDEGMVYVFRGRKVFRRFDNASADAKSDEDVISRSSAIKRKAGAAAKERFTRSSITPRLLFPSTEQQMEREERERREEEEAVTDIEIPQPEASSYVHPRTEGDTADEEMITPVKAKFKPATPPSTGKSKRAIRGKNDFADAHEVTSPHPGSMIQAERLVDHDAIPGPQTRSAKASPFTAWQRTKPGNWNESKGTKRERDGEAPETGRSDTGKRVRSGTISQAQF